MFPRSEHFNNFLYSYFLKNEGGGEKNTVINQQLYRENIQYFGK